MNRIRPVKPAAVILKKGAVADKGHFISMANEHSTGFCKLLVSQANHLQKVAFPNSRQWENKSTALNSRIKDIIQAAYKDPTVIGK
jgi:hypothetical protein